MQLTLNIPIEYNIGDCLYFIGENNDIRALLIKRILLDGVSIESTKSSIDTIAFICIDDVGFELGYTFTDLKRLKVTKSKETLISQIDKKIWLKK